MHALAFSPDGATLAVCGAAGKPQLWDVATRTLLPLPHPWSDAELEMRAICSATYSADGSLFVSGHADGSVWLWTPKTRGLRVIRRPERARGMDNWVYAVDVSPNGTLVASLDRDGMPDVWDVVTGQRAPRWSALDRDGHSEDVNCVVFTSDAQTLLSGSRDSVRLHRLAKNAPVLRSCCNLKLTLKFARACVVPAVASCSTTTFALQGIVYSPGWAIAVSPDGRMFATAGPGDVIGSIKLWELTTRTAIATLARNGHSHLVQHLAISSDGRFLASAARDGTVRMWDLSTWRCSAVLQGHRGAVDGVAFSVDNRTVISCGKDRSIRQWDVSSSEQLAARLGGHADDVHCVAFSPDGRTLASASSDGSAVLWDCSTGLAVATLTGGVRVNGVASVRFSPNGRFLAASLSNNTVRVWAVAPAARSLATQSVRVVADFPSDSEKDRPHGNPSWSNDSQRLVTTSDGAVLKVWHVAPRACVVHMRGRHPHWRPSPLFRHHRHRLRTGRQARSRWRRHSLRRRRRHRPADRLHDF